MPWRRGSDQPVSHPGAGPDGPAGGPAEDFRAEGAAEADRRRHPSPAPDVLVTIDSPGFTLRVLRALQPTTLKRAHYVAPQVWAWRERRVKHYPGLWDELLCLLPFEPAFFARHGLPARFVGHPVLESGAETGNAARFRARHCDPGRREDPDRHAGQPPDRGVPPAADPGGNDPPAAGAAWCRSCRWPGRSRRSCGSEPASWPIRPILVADTEDKHDAFAASAAALTKSGTSTLELALAKVPMLVTYRVNPVSHQIAKRMIKIQYASILNLLLDRPVVPELLQLKAGPTASRRTASAADRSGCGRPNVRGSPRRWPCCARLRARHRRPRRGAPSMLPLAASSFGDDLLACGRCDERRARQSPGPRRCVDGFEQGIVQ